MTRFTYIEWVFPFRIWWFSMGPQWQGLSSRVKSLGAWDGVMGAIPNMAGGFRWEILGNPWNYGTNCRKTMILWKKLQEKPWWCCSFWFVYYSVLGNPTFQAPDSSCGICQAVLVLKKTNVNVKVEMGWLGTWKLTLANDSTTINFSYRSRFQLNLKVSCGPTLKDTNYNRISIEYYQRYIDHFSV